MPCCLMLFVGHSGEKFMIFKAEYQIALDKNRRKSNERMHPQITLW